MEQLVIKSSFCSDAKTSAHTNAALFAYTVIRFKQTFHSYRTTILLAHTIPSFLFTLSKGSTDCLLPTQSLRYSYTRHIISSQALQFPHLITKNLACMLAQTPRLIFIFYCLCLIWITLCLVRLFMTVSYVSFYHSWPILRSRIWHSYEFCLGYTAI